MGIQGIKKPVNVHFTGFQIILVDFQRAGRDYSRTPDTTFDIF